MNDENPRMINVLSSFKEQNDNAEIIEFANEGWSIPPGGHLQGIQRLRDYFFISGSSSHSAYFVVVGRTPQGYCIVQNKIISGEPYRHAGGIQIIGDYLVVGVEDNVRKDKSRVLFFDVANPGEPVGDPVISIERTGTEKLATAGAVAIVKREEDYLLIVGSWDSDTLDFYKSNGIPFGDCDMDGISRCEFTHWRTWSKHSACKRDWYNDTWGNYQNLNLVGDVNGNLFLLGYYCNSDSEDYVDLYSLDLDKPASEMVRKEDSKLMKCKAGASFRYGGGAYVEDKKSLLTYACERNCHSKIIINEFFS